MRSAEALAALNSLVWQDKEEGPLAFRDLLILDRIPWDYDLPRADREELVRAEVFLDALDREDLTTLLLDHSLCPLHRCDYAACFDDEPPECAGIREIHPGHDT